MTHHHRKKGYCCDDNYKGYDCKDKCPLPFYQLPYEPDCRRYSLPDCSLKCCETSEECSDQLSYLAKDGKFPESFEPYLHRECTKDCDTSDSSSDCCPKPNKPHYYKCCGGKRKHGHKKDCHHYSKDSSDHEDCHKDKPHKKGWVTVCSDKSTSSTGHGKKKAREFTVTTVPKDKHPQAHRIQNGAKVWAINGYTAPRINLHEGTTYYFKVTQPDTDQAQDFFLTTDIAGGRDFADLQLKGTTVLSNGTLVLKVDSMTPRCFYYQSKQGKFRGGLILVV